MVLAPHRMLLVLSLREISAVALAGLRVIHCSKFGFAADVSEEASFISVLLGALLESSFLKRSVIDISINFLTAVNCA